MKVAILIEIWVILGLIAGFLRLAINNKQFTLLDLLYTILSGLGGLISWVFLFVTAGDKPVLPSNKDK